jgi:PleD family two-component response regulator
VAEYRGGEEPGRWVERADAALYRAKRSGKDRTVRSTD